MMDSAVIFARRAPSIVALATLAAIAPACGGGGNDGPAPPAASPPVPPPSPSAPVAHLRFANAAPAAGIDYFHDFATRSMSTMAVAGVAVGDVDADGWLDLYVAQGDTGTNLLYRNTSAGGSLHFVEEAALRGVAMATANLSAGPAFADFDGDGDDDLFVGSVGYDSLRVFANDGGGQFSDVTASTGLDALVRENNVSMAFADYDGDGDLDLFIAHWTFTDGERPAGSPQLLWRNDGDGSFTDVSDTSLMTGAALSFDVDYTFTPTFADIDGDADPDLLLVADNNLSQVIVNDGDQGGGLVTFRRITDDGVITDQAGMGSAVADFDNDGDLDWFVSSIEEQGNRDRNGNRYYRNLGDGQFEEITDIANLRGGHWGWAACAADFNNDGHLDIFHVNGIGEAAGTSEFVFDPSRLFINDGDGTFTEMSVELGIDDPRQGRGVVCFDPDRDGDIDIFIANNGARPWLYENVGGNDFAWLNIRLQGPGANTAAIGARIYVSSGGMTQLREVTNGNNYVSQNPAEQHVGLNQAAAADRIRVVWPDGTETERLAVDSRQRLVVTYPDSWSSD